jgi:hypothetical protein
MLRKTDFLWILAYPIYQLIGTLRHEAGHAIMAMVEGAQIQEFVFWPTLHENNQFFWGYVSWNTQDTTWMTTAGPYLVDLITYTIFFWILMIIPIRWRWLWLNLVIIGLLSPLLNSLYHYQGAFSSTNDVALLLQELPVTGVHLYFLTSMIIYTIGLVTVFRISSSAHLYDKQALGKLGEIGIP